MVKLLRSHRYFHCHLLAITLVSCGNHGDDKVITKETSTLKDVVLEVSEDMRKLGFPVDMSQIKIEVKEAGEMAALFNSISDESRQEVQNYTPFGPLKELQKENATFSDGDSSRLAFYDPNSRSIIFRKGSLHNLTKGYLAHELAHAYQDQKWGFTNVWKMYQDRPTRESFNVTQFIIEGHAELVRHAYEQNFVTPKDAKTMSASLAKITESDCVPCHSKQNLSTLPYVFGMRFLVNQYRLGGWALAEDVFTNLPSSTEQIIHEDKFDRDLPTDLSLPEWHDSAFNAKIILNGSLGEAYLLAKLLSMPITPDRAFSGASGWDGDVAQLYKLPDGREALVWRLVFDRIFDAQQLESVVSALPNEGSVMRIGRVVDWIITTSPDLLRTIRLHLSKHRVNFAGNRDDEQTTFEQEVSILNDATLFKNPQFVPKIVIGPKAK